MLTVTCYDKNGDELEELVQWDSDILLKVSGVEAGDPDPPMFHFCQDGRESAIVVPAEVSGDYLQALIPNILMQSWYPIKVYLYYTDEDGEGRSRYSVTIQIVPRLMPDDYEYVENIDYENWIEKMIELIGEQLGVDDTLSLSSYAADAKVTGDGLYGPSSLRSSRTSMRPAGLVHYSVTSTVTPKDFPFNAYSVAAGSYVHSWGSGITFNNSHIYLIGSLRSYYTTGRYYYFIADPASGVFQIGVSADSGDTITWADMAPTARFDTVVDLESSHDNVFTENDDLDTFLTAGTWRCPTEAVAASLVNNPFGTKVVRLFVLEASNTSNIIMQMVISSGETRIAIRSYRQSISKWGSWSYIAMENDNLDGDQVYTDLTFMLDDGTWLYNKEIAGIESSTTATSAYNTGDTIIVGENVYTVTASIASGASITVGTNAEDTGKKILHSHSGLLTDHVSTGTQTAPMPVTGGKTYYLRSGSTSAASFPYSPSNSVCGIWYSAAKQPLKTLTTSDFHLCAFRNPSKGGPGVYADTAYAHLMYITAPSNAKYLSLNWTQDRSNSGFPYFFVSSIQCFPAMDSGDQTFVKNDPRLAFTKTRKLAVIGPSTAMIDRLNRGSQGHVPAYISGFQEYLAPYYKDVITFGYSGGAMGSYNEYDATTNPSGYVSMYKGFTQNLSVDDANRAAGCDDFLIMGSTNQIAQSGYSVGMAKTYAQTGSWSGTDSDVTTYIGGLAGIIDKIFTLNANARVFVCTIANGTSNTSMDKIEKINAQVAKLAEIRGISVINMSRSITHENVGNYTYDGIHWNNAGHIVTAQRMIAGLLDIGDGVGAAESPGHMSLSEVTEDWTTYPGELTRGGYTADTGSSPAYYCSAMISVTPGEHILLEKCMTSKGADGRNICFFYDSNGVYINGAVCPIGYATYDSLEIVVPTGAAYMRTMCRAANVTKAKIFRVEDRIAETPDSPGIEWLEKAHAAAARNLGDAFARARAGHGPIFTLIDDDTRDLNQVTDFQFICDDYPAWRQAVHGETTNAVVYGTSAAITKNLLKDLNVADTLLKGELDGHQTVFHCHEQNGNTIWSGDDSHVAEATANTAQGIHEMEYFGFADWKHWVMPGGAHGATLQRLARRFGMDSMVSITQNDYMGYDGFWDRWCIPRMELYPDDTGHAAGNTLAGIKAMIDKAAANNGWLLVGIHVYQDADYSDSYAGTAGWNNSDYATNGNAHAQVYLRSASTRWTMRGDIDAAGDFTGDTTLPYFVSYMIPVTAGETLRLKNCMTSQARKLAYFYDASGNFLSATSKTSAYDTQTSEDVTVPSGAAFVRVLIRDTNVSEAAGVFALVSSGDYSSELARFRTRYARIYEMLRYADQKGMTFVTLSEGLSHWEPVFRLYETF